MALRPIARSTPTSASRLSRAIGTPATTNGDRRRELERKRRGRRHAVERVLPCGRGARDQHHAVADRDQTGGADSERRIGDLETVRRNIKSRESWRVQPLPSVSSRTQAPPANGSTATLPNAKP